MVHALEEIHRLLKPNGCLIEIHPDLEAPLFKIYQGSSIVFLAPDPNYDYEDDLLQAEDALEQVVQRRLFAIERSAEFDFLTYGSSVAELKDFWAEAGAYDETPKADAVAAQAEELYARVEEVMLTLGQGVEAALHERARINRLRPIQS